jgi:hypothetical protein
MGFDQGDRGQPFGMSGGARRHRIDNQAVAVLQQRVAPEAQPRLLAGALAEQPGVRIGGRGVRVVFAALAMKSRKSRSLLRPGPGGSPEPSLGRKLFGLAQASSKVPSTEKCSLDSNP